MRLSHIKLAGFKSFVDPTSIAVPGQLVAVCGPNGCGKSNVIDAVRWVLGESSAKQLRGESMQDVIFNGSTTRKAVSRASVELVFDNSAGTVQSQWGQFTEISIKRVLTRQGESNYCINNQAVRRRDITDLFLGTGVGKGGYAIIGQGMINRIIEASPEELRHFLEEAAGVSKYKERRRETESRLADTRDNLARVEDIRQELERQLDKLAAQAEVASRYQNLRETITEKQNLLALLRKLEAAREAEAARQAIDAAQTALDAQLAQLRAQEARLEELREAHFRASDDVHHAQGHLYDANATVARLEQQLQHLRQTRQRLSQEAQSARDSLQRLDETRRQLAAEMEDWLLRSEEASLRAEETALQAEEEHLRLPELEQAQAELDECFQSLRERHAQARAAAQLARQQAQNHARQRDQLRERLTRLTAEQARTVVPDEGEDDQLELDAARMALEELVLGMQDSESRLQEIREQQQDLRQQHEQARLSLAAQQTRHEVLTGLQTPRRAGELDAWLKQQGYAALPALLATLTVEAGYAELIETALGMRLKSLMVDGYPDIPPPDSLLLVRPGRAGALAPEAVAQTGLATLASYVQAHDARWQPVLADWLAPFLVADDLVQALAWQDQLHAAQQILTRDGHSVERHAVHYQVAAAGETGALARQQELAALDAALPQAEETVRLAAMQLSEAGSSLLQIEAQLREQRQLENRQRQYVHQAEREQARRQAEREQASLRMTQLQDELRQLRRQLDDEERALRDCESEAVIQEAALAPLDEQLENLKLDRVEAETALTLKRSQLREADRQAQEARFAVQSAAQRLAELSRRSEDLVQQQDAQQERLAELLEELAGIDEGDFDVGFQDAVNIRSEKERLLAAARDTLNGIAQQLREVEAARQLVEATLEPAREAVSAARLAEQEARLALERFAQELAEAAADEALLQQKLEPGMKVGALVSEIGKLSQAVNALGAVNLAALQELEAAREREGYLQAQSADLYAAMDTLENAIRRIDRETRALLQGTYDAVNGNLQELFPMLFGGGHAELVLTGEEILDAGLQIMAQPPGKKNATIHLLSGGEKALTALSLVFSLFRLNPAPFCLLDEVDAPLDDANTLRFCDLVKKMAERTQFLFISHNRLAMEMAEQLVGVTMQEQGVSRVVAVDIAAALDMREAAPA
ncbi:chromosome segregation protein SMC [Chitinilyticum piscinae]|uniref:Chromosome partition protein Smc n=1 Tax=Chitinilyticum piscinae TaxID=2866724 RepID=A0A8J7FHT1_9NEIS|nr:chromosome segregation protein SMC [Chitinilyticum piscinae]MBE9609505.1 chromosome segregation protein SMC [Chitinilyticum piscinae]